MKTIAAVILVMMTLATSCSPWSKSSEDWSVSSGTAIPIVADTSGASNTAFSVTPISPNSIEDENPTSALKSENATPQRKLSQRPGSQTQCARGSDRRTLAVIRHGAGCRLSYQTRSHVENVAEATWGKQVCQQVRSKIVQKLKTAGYSCS
ncbi:MAG: hypothetical protein ACJ763_10480 [Bdellovibrionia bacterium]